MNRELAKDESDYTFHLTQKQLSSIEIMCPLSIKQEKYLNDDEHDVVVWGGSAGAGKTQLSLLKLLLSGLYDEDYVGGIARASQKQMKIAGSLWNTGVKLFNKFDVRSNRIELSWLFPSGATVNCHHLYDNQEDWHGSQMTECLVDEAQQCKEDDVWFLTSRLRSQSEQKHQIRLTCNPDSKSFLRYWLQKAGYVGDDGYAVKEMDGVTTYMLQVEGEFKWWKSRSEMNKDVGRDAAKFAQKFVFYAANVYDNPYIRKHIPSYIHKLENAKPAERAKYLLGNWLVKNEGDGFVKREWFKECSWSEVPVNGITARAYDLAGTKPHAGNKNPDYTRGVKATYDRETGCMYITGMVSMRDSVAMVDRLITSTAMEDGGDCYVGIPVDVGVAGKQVADMKKAKLAVLGFKVVLMATRKNKLQRAEPFLIALQEGKVFVAPDVFREEHFFELENFDGVKNNGQHDDIMDCLGDLYTMFTSNKLIPTIRMQGVENSANYRRLGGRTFL